MGSHLEGRIGDLSADDPAGGRWIDRLKNVPPEEAPEPITKIGPGLHKPGESGLR